MTIKQLVNMSVEELEAMSDEQLALYCKPFLEVQMKAAPVIEDDDDEVINLEEAKERKKQTKEDLKKQWMQLALQHGIDISQFNLPKGLK
jgi:hypothetical protein